MTSEETQPSRPANPSLTLVEAPNPRVIRRPLNGCPKKAGWLPLTGRRLTKVGPSYGPEVQAFQLTAPVRHSAGLDVVS